MVESPASSENRHLTGGEPNSATERNTKQDPTFSEYSYGFRPGRSAHGAVLQAKRYLLDGYTHVVDMDLSKFFDRVNHDRLMSRLATRIRDKRVLKLIRRYLTAGTMIGGLISPGIERN